MADLPLFPANSGISDNGQVTLPNTTLNTVNGTTLNAPLNLTSSGQPIVPTFGSTNPLGVAGSLSQAAPSLMFPSNLGTANIPIMQFQVINFQSEWVIMANQTGSSKLQQTPPLTTTLATISLPLPQEINDSISPNWEMQNSPFVSDMEQLVGIARKSGLDDKQRVSKVVQSLIGDTKAITMGDVSKKLQYKTANPKKQAFFNGIDARTFNWSWLLAAQSTAEAEMIYNIITTFRRAALPGITSADDTFFDFPNEFKIQFTGVTGYPVFPGTLVCHNVSTNFSSAGTELLSSNHAVQIALNMTFQETTIRTKTSPGM